jgi:shikimate dehydrogenase
MKPGGHTLAYAVLGHPVRHTLSPAMHNAAFHALGMDAVYLAFDVKPDAVMPVLCAMREMGFGGTNLTVPLKEIAFRGLEDLEASATNAGAVNTVSFQGCVMRGFNTDGYGLLTALREAFGTAAEGEDIAILGSGGAARAAALVCARSGAASLSIVARNEKRAGRLEDDIKSAAPCTAVRSVTASAEQPSAVRAATLVIQATPVGLHAEDPPLFPAEAFRPGQKLYDLVYNHPETSTMKASRASGARAENGLGMLLHQGVKAFQIWTGVTPPADVMRGVLEESVYQ